MTILNEAPEVQPPRIRSDADARRLLGKAAARMGSQTARGQPTPLTDAQKLLDKLNAELRPVLIEHGFAVEPERP